MWAWTTIGLIVTGEVRRGDCGPVAMNTQFGWVLSGPVNQSSTTGETTVNYENARTLRIDTRSVTDLQDTLANFWELESIVIKQNCDSMHEKFLEYISFDEERYKVKCEKARSNNKEAKATTRSPKSV